MSKDMLTEPEMGKLAIRLATHVANELRAAGYPPSSVLVVAAGMISSVTRDPADLGKVMDAVRELAVLMAASRKVESSDG